jgi:hypothetical protein
MFGHGFVPNDVTLIPVRKGDLCNKYIAYVFVTHKKTSDYFM